MYTRQVFQLISLFIFSLYLYSIYNLFILILLGLTKTNRVLLWPILPSLPLDSITIHYNTDTNDSSNVYYKVYFNHNNSNDSNILDIEYHISIYVFTLALSLSSIYVFYSMY